MVHWNELSDVLTSNPFQTYNVKGLLFAEPIRKGFQHFPIEAASVAAAVVPMDVDDDTYFPPPTLPATTVTTTVTPAAKVTPTATVTAAAAPVSRVSRKTPDVLKYTLDPIVFGIEHVDILYNDSPKASKRQMEIDEALRCESRIDELYKSQGGRSRGWTKTMLETVIRPRCASGGDLYALKQAKCVFLWQMVAEDKAISGFLDFLCVAKQIQIAIWNDERHIITVYPAADYVGDGARTTRPLYNVAHNGMMMRNGSVNTGVDLVKFASENGWTLMPPHSMVHSLEKLTLADLESVGKKLGMAEVTGSKIERIAAVAGYKLKTRLAGTAV